MKLQLVTPRHTLAGYATNVPRPPIGLEIIAAFLERDFAHIGQSIEIEILDGEIIAHEELVSLIDADWVGFSSLFSNHENCVTLAEIAKSRGAKVVFGGPNATHLARQILKNHPFVDFVIVGDGEEALSALLRGVDLHKVPNLVFRTPDGLAMNPVRLVDINAVPLFNFEHLRNNSRYFEDNEPFPLCCIRGCAKAVLKGRCLYCSCHLTGLRTLEPERVWKQIKLLQDHYGITSFFEAGDSFLVNVPGKNQGKWSILYPELLLRTRPADLHPSFRIYERPDMIERKHVQLLRELGVDEIFLGFEHVNISLRKQAKRIVTGQDIWKILATLQEYDIKVVLALLYGIPGESLNSAEENSTFIFRVTEKFKNVSKLFISVVLPLAGTALFSRLLSEPEIVHEYNVHGHNLAEDDIFDYDLLTRLMINKFCTINAGELEEIVRHVRESIPDEKKSFYGKLDLG